MSELMCILLAAVGSAAACAFGAPGAAAAPGGQAFTGELEVVVWKGLFQGGKPGESGANMVWDLSADEGLWGRAYGMALNYNQGDHSGYVEEGTVTAEKMLLKVNMDIGGDNWIPGGKAIYKLDLKRLAGGKLEGTYEAAFKGQKYSGRATGRVKPPRPMLVKDFQPVRPGEHPRILFRKSDLPALRAKLNTPLGKAYLAKAGQGADANDFLSMGMLYQLTGDAKYAARAMKTIQGFGGEINPSDWGTGGVGHRFVAAALTYDLCHDGWPEAFRRQIEEALVRNIQDNQVTLPTAHPNYHPCSNYYGPGRGAPAVATLAIYADPGPEPPKPVDPAAALAGGDDIVTILRTREMGMAKAKADYAERLAQWRIAHKEWQAAGGADIRKLALVAISRAQVLRHYRVGVGDGGFQAETGGYAMIATWYPLLYGVFHRTVFGRDASADPDITQLMPRRMMQVLFKPDGKTVVQKINSAAGFDVCWCAAAFPICPDQYKPGLLWAWNKVCGITGPETAGNALAAGWPGGGLPLALAFLHYPLELKPVHPAQSMPKTWRADTFGFYVFRSGWQGSDEFIAQVFLKAVPVGGWNHPNAAGFQVYGLGHPWTDCPASRNGARELYPVVLLPADQTNQGSCGRLAYWDGKADGSGELTIDMNDVYGSTKIVGKRLDTGPHLAPRGMVKIDMSKIKDWEGAQKHTGLYDGNLLRIAENFESNGISGLRAMAFDYSGASGVPCLMAMVDKVVGGKTKLWTWTISADMLDKVKVDPAGGGFAIDYGDASMKATFVEPRGVKIEAGKDELTVGDPRHGYHGPVWRVKAASQGSFFVVLTFQRGSAPAVKVDGAGLDAVVRVGKRTVRFDGAKIALGE